MAKKIKTDSKKFVRVERALAEEISAFLFAVGGQFVGVKNAEGAFDCYKYSLDLNPQSLASVFNLGQLYNLKGNTEGAYRMFREAVRMNPTDIKSRTLLAETSRKIGKVQDSMEILSTLFKEDPDNHEVMSALALLNFDNGRIAEAMEWNERALEKTPDDLKLQLNQALIHMTYGKWAEWWHKYEYCLSYQRNEKMGNLQLAKAWSGQLMEGKTLLVVSDQGSGDAIQFSKYLYDAKRMGGFAKLIFLAQPDLKEILGRIPWIDEVIGFGERMNVEYDAFSSLLGVMRVTQISPRTSGPAPHLVSNPDLDKVWKARVNEQWDGKSTKVGIVWAGDPRHGNDHARSIPLTKFLTLQQVEGVQLFSLQAGPGLRQLESNPLDEGWGIAELGSDFRNFDDTASALKQMDVLISVDTSVAHLGGSLGVPTWVLLPNPPEWRWLLDRDDSVWYESVKLFRQRESRNWDDVFAAVTKELQYCAK